MHTLKSLRDEVLNWMDEAGDTGTTATNVDNAINQAHTQRLTQDKWPFMLWPDPLTFSLVNGQTHYALSQAFSRPLYFYNRTKQTFLKEIPPRGVTEGAFDWVNSTTGLSFVLHGTMPVQSQPSAASVVTIVSSDTADNNVTKAVIVRGLTASGISTETITPAGTTPVSGTTSFTQILNVTLSAAWTGTLTLSVGSTTILTLAAGEYGRQYPRLRLLYNPDSTDLIEYQFYRTPTTLTHDYDIPELPFPHSGILVWDALLQLSAYDNDATGGRIEIWLNNQKRMELQLRQSYLEGQTLGAQPRYVRDLTDQSSFA